MAFQRTLAWVLGLVLGMSFAYAHGEAAVGQTLLSPAAAIEGEDPEVLKSHYDRWNKLPKVTAVSGVVVNESNMPTPGAKIVVNVDYGVRLEGKADDQGRFRFAIPEPYLNPIYAEALEGAMAGVSATTRDQGTGKIEAKVTLFPTREVSFTVRNAAGAPTAGASCGAFIGRSVIARGRADGKGSVRLRIPEFPLPEGMAAMARQDPNRLLMVYGFSDEHGLGVLEFQRQAEGREYPDELSLAEAKPLKVKVVDRDGKAMAGLPVVMVGYYVTVVHRLLSGFGDGLGGGRGGFGGLSNIQAPLSGDARGFVKSNASGEAEIKWFAPYKMPEEGLRMFGNRTTSPVVFAAIHPEWPSASAMLEDESTSPKASIVVYSPSKIRGQVSLPSGEPAAGIKIRPRQTRTPQGEIKEIVTNDRGEFDMVATTEAADFFVQDPKWVADPIRLRELVQKSAESGIAIKLREGKRVSFSMTGGPEYLPQAGRQIVISENTEGSQTSGAGTELILTTDAEGRAEAALDRGLYSISVAALGETSASSTTTLLVKNQPKIEVALHVSAPTSRMVALTVKKSDGKTPAAGAKVEVINAAYLNRLAASERGAAMERAMAERGARVEGFGVEGFGAGGAIGGPGGGGFGGGRAGRGGDERGRAPGDWGGGGIGGGGPSSRASAPIPTVADEKGLAAIKAPIAAEAWLLVTGGENEVALVRVDVLADSLDAVLKPTVKLKGRLIDQETGEAIVGATVSAALASAQIRPASNPMGRGGLTMSTGNHLTPNAVTNAKGEFELSNLIAEAQYQLYLDGVAAAPPGTEDGERFGGFAGGGFGTTRRTRISNFAAPKEGSSDLGDIKTQQPAPPPRPRIPNDPNGQ